MTQPDTSMIGDHPDCGEFAMHTNPDAMAWVQFFRRCNPDCNIADDVMLGWFANAMMAMHDHLKGNPILNGDHAQYLIDTAQLCQSTNGLRDAYEECRVYNRMGGLDSNVIADIAAYHGVSVETLKEKCEEGL